jgi:hypothetical protein
LSSETALVEVVRHVVGQHTAVRVNDWHVRRPNYVVASVETQQPALRLIVKLEVPGERPNRHLESMAAIARLVRSQTSVPTFDVVAVDTTRHRRAAGQLHALRFEAFGQIGSDGSVIDGSALLPALVHRAQRRLTKPGHLAVMLDALEKHGDLFAGLSIPTLCHEDLNPNNLVFTIRAGHPALVGILDFESALGQHRRVGPGASGIVVDDGWSGRPPGLRGGRCRRR